MLMEINSSDLDNYITGHYGEDQFSGDECDEGPDADGNCPFEQGTYECPYCKDGKCTLDDDEAGEGARQA